MSRQPADDENDDKRQHDLGDLLARHVLPPHLAVARSLLRRGVTRTAHERARDQHVERCDDDDRNDEVDDEAVHGVELRVGVAPGVRVRVTHRRVVDRLDASGHRLERGERRGGEPDDSHGEQRGDRRRALALRERVYDGAVAVSAERHQREDGRGQRDGLHEGVQLADRLAIRPLGERVDGRREGHRHKQQRQVAHS